MPQRAMACNVRLLNDSTAQQTCRVQHNGAPRNFGCVPGHADVMWVDAGCRGLFTCGPNATLLSCGRTFASYSRPMKMACSCDPEYAKRWYIKSGKKPVKKIEGVVGTKELFHAKYVVPAPPKIERPQRTVFDPRELLWRGKKALPTGRRPCEAGSCKKTSHATTVGCVTPCRRLTCIETVRNRRHQIRSFGPRKPFTQSFLV